MHVGDSLLTDIQGGINAGLAATAWVNRNGHALPQQAPSPTYIISKVTEVGALLEELQALPKGHASFQGFGFAHPELQELGRA